MNLEKIAKNVFAKTEKTMLESIEFLREEERKSKDTHVTKDIFRAIRLSLKLTQEEFADLLRVTSKSVSRWERGESVPELSFEQYCTLAYELKKIGVNLLNLHAYKISAYPDELMIISLGATA